MRIVALGRVLPVLSLGLLAAVPQVLLLSTPRLAAQTTISGDLIGRVSDPSGAVIPAPGSRAKA